MEMMDKSRTPSIIENNGRFFVKLDRFGFATEWLQHDTLLYNTTPGEGWETQEQAKAALQDRRYNNVADRRFTIYERGTQIVMAGYEDITSKAAPFTTVGMGWPEEEHLDIFDLGVGWSTQWVVYPTSYQRAPGTIVRTR